MARKQDPAFQELLREFVAVNHETGRLHLNGVYASLAVNIGWKGKVVVVPYSHLVWFLTHGRWPKEGYHIDHMNNDPFDNRPCNLAELTKAENQAKRRGRMVYRSYGKGKYGHGINVTLDKRDGRYYVRHYKSRGHGKGDLKHIRHSLGGYASLKEAETMVANYIASFPGPVGPNSG